MTLRRITAPGTTPVTAIEMADHLRADLSAETPIINAYIGAITEKAENHTRRALITQTWELVLDCFPVCSIPLPLSPVQSVTSVKYTDIDGVLQTITAGDYTLTADDPNAVVPAYGKTWPSTRQQPGAVVIRYVCGYGDDATAVPDSIKVWMMLNVANLYENRETVVVGKTGFADLSTMADSLLDSYRLVTF